MDVRCERCQTEYELDETKVTEAGVTVKCTTCGNLFKVRRKTASLQGVSAPEPRRSTSIPSETDDRQWMVRSPEGEIQKFKELTTLQRWIVERKVNREHEISRSGETWKRLGEIAELASFFQVVDAAVAPGAPQTGGHRRATQPFGVGPVVPPATAGSAPPAMVPATTLQGQAGAPKLPAMLAPTPIPGQAPLPPARPPGLATAPTMLAGTAPVLPHTTPAAPVRPPAAVPQPIGPEPSGPRKNANAGPANLHMDDSEPSGPTGGLQGAPVFEPGWASGAEVQRTRAHMLAEGNVSGPMSAQRPAQQPPPQSQPSQSPSSQSPSSQSQPRFQAMDDVGDDADLVPARSKAPWIALGLLVVAGGAAGAWFLVFNKKSGEKTVQQATAPDSAVPGPLDAGTVVVIKDPVVQKLDAGPPPGVDTATAYHDAVGRFYDDTDEAFQAAEDLLAKAHVADTAQETRVLAALALVNSSWAQYLTDDAEAVKDTDKHKADQLRAEAGRRLTKAKKYADDASARAPKDPEALIAQADVLRQSKGKTGAVEKLLAPAQEFPEALYVKGMLRWRDGKADAAVPLLIAAADGFKGKQGRDHLRARYRLAAIAIAGKKFPEAKASLETILAAQPQHARARALAEKIPADEPVAVIDPVDPKLPTDPGHDPGHEPDSTGPVSAEQYGGLVEKADNLAENGNCTAAMKLYERALEARPSGVEALTGLGYCHLDKGDYAKAQSHFRTALNISSRYADALWGMAETYKAQGDKERAVEYYQKYLDNHPSGPKAAGARKNIDQLGGGGTTAPPDNPPDDPPKDPPKDPTPPDKSGDPPPDKQPDNTPPPEEKKPDPPAEAPGATP